MGLKYVGGKVDFDCFCLVIDSVKFLNNWIDDVVIFWGGEYGRRNIFGEKNEFYLYLMSLRWLLDILVEFFSRYVDLWV